MDALRVVDEGDVVALPAVQGVGEVGDFALAAEEGYELSDEELAAVSGGVDWSCWSVCPSQKACDKYEDDWC